MDPDELNPDIPPELERYISLCERIFERMMRTGEWPWQDEGPLAG